MIKKVQGEVAVEERASPTPVLGQALAPAGGRVPLRLEGRPRALTFAAVHGMSPAPSLQEAPNVPDGMNDHLFRDRSVLTIS